MSDFLRRDDDFDDLFEFVNEESDGGEKDKKTAQHRMGFGAFFARIRARRKAHEGGKKSQTASTEAPLDAVAPPLPDLQGDDLWLQEAETATEPAEIAPNETSRPPTRRESKPRPTPKRSSFWHNLSRGQRLILGLLMLAVLIVYLLLGWTVFTSTRRAAPPAPTLAVVAPAGTPMTTWETPPDVESIEEESTQPTATPTPTPPPFAAISTKYDLQVYQHPDDLTLRLKRGAEYLRLRAYEAAIADFKYALSLDEKNAEAWVGLGEAYFYLRRWKEAEKAFQTAIAFDEHLALAHSKLGYLYYWWGRYLQAAREFAWAAELNPDDVQAWSYEAMAYAQAGEVEKAKTAVETAFTLDENYPQAYIARAWVRALEGDQDDALADLLYARELAPHDFTVLDALARFYAEAMPERAIEGERIILQAMNWTRWDLEKAEALQTLGRLYLAEGRIEEARKAFTEASDLATADGRVVLPGLTEDLDKTLSP